VDPSNVPKTRSHVAIPMLNYWDEVIVTTALFGRYICDDGWYIQIEPSSCNRSRGATKIRVRRSMHVRLDLLYCDVYPSSTTRSQNGLFVPEKMATSKCFLKADLICYFKVDEQ
jgi:hypothetical protein